MSRISEATRRQVADRAGFRCEYCRVGETVSFLAFEIDHVIGRKHGGGDELENLAFACPHCNVHKGSDLTTFLDNYQDLVPLFNPRLQSWKEHFEGHAGAIIGLSPIGLATVKLLKLNDPDRIIQRKLLAEAGRWPA